jgi:L-asparaginase
VIAILFTGGTISMTADESGSVRPALASRDILEQTPGLAGIAEIEVEDFSRLPGPHVTPEQMWRLARRAAAWLERPDVDGLVVTHGTDTLEESAFFIDLVLTSEKPVVLLGAMRPASDAEWDGPANIAAAVRLAAAPGARGRGALIVFAGTVLAAREARKLHSQKPAAFGAPGLGPVAAIDRDRVRFLRRAPTRPAWSAEGAEAGMRVARIETRVDLVSASAGADDRFVRCALDSGARGLVVEAFGSGNVPPGLREGIRTALEAHVPVLVASRAVAGGVRPRYGYEGGGRDLVELGAMMAGPLSALKARILLRVALGGARNRDDLARIVAGATSAAGTDLG